MRTLAAILLLITSFTSLAHAQSRIRILTHGGGDISPETAELFVHWAGDVNSKILIVTWPSSSAQDDYFKSISKSFIDQGVKPENIRQAHSPPTDEESANIFREDLKWASAVFTSGGDQERYMNAIHRWDLEKDLMTRIEDGMPYGGKSAGGASQSQTMINGNPRAPGPNLPTRVPLATGLPIRTSFLVDTHFFQRTRINRLLQAMLESGVPQGIGLDFGAGLFTVGGKYSKLLGGYALAVKIVNGISLQTELKSGDTFNTETFERDSSECFWKMYGLPEKTRLLLKP